MDNNMEVWEKERYVVFEVKRVRKGGYVGIRIESDIGRVVEYVDMSIMVVIAGEKGEIGSRWRVVR